MRNNMVRVISVHNFLKQDISSLDEVNDAAVVPPDILLLVKSNNTILVRDLSLPDDPGYTIPTIDQVVKIVYSIQGNYIAALENKITRNGTKVSYVRVYVNWETLRTCRDSFPMRARIAGRVTPLSQSQQGLEMIEIPSQHMPDNVSCCSISGNLLLSSRSVLTIYSFATQTHDISKIHFIDFKQLPVDLHLPFTPLRIQLLENVIAAQNDEFLYVFQIKSALPMCSLSDKEFSIDDFEKVQNSHSKLPKERKTINYNKLSKEFEQIRFSSTMDNSSDLQKILTETSDSKETELSKINLLSFPLRHEFPTVAMEKSLGDSRFPDVFRQNPFAPSNDLTVNLVSNSSNCPKNQYKTTNLCQYHLAPLTIGSVTNREIQEKFVILILKPFYSNDENGKTVKQRLLESNYYKNLKCIACFFGTQQEGYLHCFEFDNTGEQDAVLCGNYVTYAFTAPLIDAQLSDCFIHAITEAGLETYTMRAAKHLLKKTETTECPSSGDPVCLIGLNPFVNILKSFITKNFLTLFANNEESSWTLYQLKSPDAPAVWKDFLSAAEDNKWEAPLTYCELLSEGHLVLKTALKTLQWVSCRDAARNQLCFAKIAEQQEEILKSCYKESCALLGDYHILNKNYKSSYCYYTMSGYKIVDVIKRIRSLWESIPEGYKENYNEKDITKGLIFVLKKILYRYDEKYYEFVGNREEFFSPDIGNLVTSLMDLLEKEENNSISDLVLESVVLREFSTDRILKMLKSLLSKKSATQDKDALSLALMCIQRDQTEQAKTVLMTMKPNQLEALLLQYYILLFANQSSSGTNMFTELSMVLIEIHPSVLATVLSDLVTVKRLLSLSKVLNFFMDLLPSGGVRSKNSSLVLQIVLEKYFKCYAENFGSKKFDYKTTEALKILIRIYLTRLQAKKGSENDKEEEEAEDASEILFIKSRWNYLGQMPPFGHGLNQIVSNSSREDLSNDQKTILLKIQSLLSFDGLQKECLAEVRNFLSKQPNICGSLSLQVLSAQTVQEAIDLLIDFAPQSLTQFSKERVNEKDDWKYLVAQLHKKAYEANGDSRIKFFLQQILSEILHHTAENLNIEDLIDILPKDYEDAERYLAIAQNSAQANHIKTLIMITGKQLLASL